MTISAPGTETSAPESVDAGGLLGWDAAHALGISERHLKLLWTERRISGVKVGRLVRFRPEDIADYIARHSVEAVR